MFQSSFQGTHLFSQHSLQWAHNSLGIKVPDYRLLHIYVCVYTHTHTHIHTLLSLKSLKLRLGSRSRGIPVSRSQELCPSLHSHPQHSYPFLCSLLALCCHGAFAQAAPSDKLKSIHSSDHRPREDRRTFSDSLHQIFPAPVAPWPSLVWYLVNAASFLWCDLPLLVFSFIYSFIQWELFNEVLLHTEYNVKCSV